MRLRIKEIARERGIKLAAIAGHLKMHRSNLSGIASGSRGISLKVLAAIGRFLGCGIDELVDDTGFKPVFRDKHLESLVAARENNSPDGTDKSWVNNLMAGHRLHFAGAKRSRS